MGSLLNWLINQSDSNCEIESCPKGKFWSILKLADKLSCEKLLAAFSKFFLKKTTMRSGQGMASRNCTKIVQETPKFAAALLVAFSNPDH